MSANNNNNKQQQQNNENDLKDIISKIQMNLLIYF